jgi:hypothetical protein
VAQDPQQARLYTELYLENGKRYSFRSGESHPTPSEGLVFEDAAVALACAHRDITYSVQAIREVGKLWEDINQAPYTILFNAKTSTRRMWNAVEMMRAVELVLKIYQSESEGKAKLIATHGNRFVLHMIFRALDPDKANDVNAMRQSIEEAVRTTLDRLITATMNRYESSYPSNLFKNLTKCRELATVVQKEQPRLKHGVWLMAFEVGVASRSRRGTPGASP